MSENSAASVSVLVCCRQCITVQQLTVTDSTQMLKVSVEEKPVMRRRRPKATFFFAERARHQAEISRCNSSGIGSVDEGFSPFDSEGNGKQTDAQSVRQTPLMTFLWSPRCIPLQTEADLPQTQSVHCQDPGGLVGFHSCLTPPLFSSLSSPLFSGFHFDFVCHKKMHWRVSVAPTAVPTVSQISSTM